jgi:hypothetical protein
MRGDIIDDVFWCLDLERDQWFRVESNSLKEERSGDNFEISGTCTNTTGSLVCSVRRNYPEMSFVLVDLRKDECTKMNFTAREGDFSINKPENIKFYGDVCIVSLKKEIQRMHYLYDNSSFGDIHQRFRKMSLMGATSYDQLVAQHMIGDILPTTRYINISTLYIGHK